MSAEVKLFGRTVIEAIPQLSDDPSSTFAGIIVALPNSSRPARYGWQEAVGFSVSSTVII